MVESHHAAIQGPGSTHPQVSSQEQQLSPSTKKLRKLNLLCDRLDRKLEPTPSRPSGIGNGSGKRSPCRCRALSQNLSVLTKCPEFPSTAPSLWGTCMYWLRDFPGHLSRWFWLWPWPSRPNSSRHPRPGCSQDAVDAASPLQRVAVV